MKLVVVVTSSPAVYKDELERVDQDKDWGWFQC